jgi:hydrogenase expression/formation protein HypC
MCLGIPGRIIDIYESGGLLMGKIDFGGVTREACLSYVPEAAVGDYAIIHVGFAISRLSEKEAEKTLLVLRDLADIEAELAMPVSGDEHSRRGNPPDCPSGDESIER